jgi:hypothetical protein
MSVQASAIRNSLIQLMENGTAKGVHCIGTPEQLQGVVKIIDNPKIFDAIVMGDYRYPTLPKRQYLVACVDNGLNVKLWGVYTSGHIEALERANKSSLHVDNVEWKILDLTEGA